PPGPRARVPGALVLAFYRDMLGFLCRLQHEYGDVVAFRLGPEHTVLLSHPEHIHEVLVTQHRAFTKGRRGDVSKQFLGEGLLSSEGAVHQRQRHLDTFIYRLIDERRATGGDTGDVLSMLVRARFDDGSPMSARQVHDETLTLLLAGHETTALALSWTWYLLAQHPDVDAALQAELQTVLGGRLPTVENLPQLQYTRMVLSEALRLYPPAWLMTRRAREEVAIGDYRFPPGTFFLISPYITHRDRRSFLNREAVVPARCAVPPD